MHTTLPTAFFESNAIYNERNVQKIRDLSLNRIDNLCTSGIDNIMVLGEVVQKYSENKAEIKYDLGPHTIL